jgi:uncharacterized membrane protein
VQPVYVFEAPLGLWLAMYSLQIILFVVIILIYFNVFNKD